MDRKDIVHIIRQSLHNSVLILDIVDPLAANDQWTQLADDVYESITQAGLRFCTFTTYPPATLTFDEEDYDDYRDTK